MWRKTVDQEGTPFIVFHLGKRLQKRIVSVFHFNAFEIMKIQNKVVSNTLRLENAKAKKRAH